MRRAAVVLLVSSLALPGCAQAQQSDCRVARETVVNDTLRVRQLVCTRTDTVIDTVAVDPAPPAAAAPAAGGAASVPSPDCTVVVTDAESPQAAVEAAQPGDVICLRGTFGLSMGVRGGGLGRNGLLLVHAKTPGTAEQPITLRSEPGQEARIVGDFDEPTNLYVYIAASHWRVQGLTIETGGIVIGVVEDVHVIENTIRKPVFPNGNAGAVRTLGDVNVGARDILIEGNLIEDIYGCNSGPLHPCTRGSVVPWNQVRDIIHLAGIFKQGVDKAGEGTHTIRGNTIRRVPALVALKHPSDDVVVIERNTFANAKWTGNCATRPTVRWNSYAGVGNQQRGCPRG